ncbi:MAG: hypothetical protein ACTSSP_09040, partial [Candidatus Asgardarchaeia archaeon]
MEIPRTIKDESEFQAILAEKINLFGLEDIPVKDYTDLTRLFKETGSHVLITGITRAGKTTFLWDLLIELAKKGFSIIHRDDLGKEFLHLAFLQRDYGILDDYALNVFIPRTSIFKIRNQYFPTLSIWKYEPAN